MPSASPGCGPEAHPERMATSRVAIRGAGAGPAKRRNLEANVNLMLEQSTGNSNLAPFRMQGQANRQKQGETKQARIPAHGSGPADKGASSANSGRYRSPIVVVGNLGADVDRARTGCDRDGCADNARVPPDRGDGIWNHIQIDEALDFSGLAVDEANLVVAGRARCLEFQFVALVAVDQRFELVRLGAGFGDDDIVALHRFRGFPADQEIFIGADALRRLDEYQWLGRRRCAGLGANRSVGHVEQAHRFSGRNLVAYRIAVSNMQRARAHRGLDVAVGEAFDCANTGAGGLTLATDLHRAHFRCLTLNGEVSDAEREIIPAFGKRVKHRALG